MNTTDREQTHAPSHLREQFQEWLDSYEPNRLGEIEIESVSALLDALAECGDILPADYCDQLEIPKGSTYGEAVEDLRQWCGRLQRPAVERAAEGVCGAQESEHQDGQAICEGNRPQFLGVAILARHDPSAPFSMDNCYFRTAVSEEEAREGSELHVGADLRDRFLELERQGWVHFDEERRRLLMQLGGDQLGGKS